MEVTADLSGKSTQGGARVCLILPNEKREFGSSSMEKTTKKGKTGMREYSLLMVDDGDICCAGGSQKAFHGKRLESQKYMGSAM